MLNKDAWQKFSPLLEQALDMAEQRTDWLAQLEVENPEAATGVDRARAGMDELKASPLRTDVDEISAALDMASAYSEAGQDLKSRIDPRRRIYLSN